MNILVPVSLGELLDKIIILKIKKEKIRHTEKLRNINKELQALNVIKRKALKGRKGIRKWERDLNKANRRIWDLEEIIRKKESKRDYGVGFIQCARQIYKTNDLRALAKMKINMAIGSVIMEVKSYK